MVHQQYLGSLWRNLDAIMALRNSYEDVAGRIAQISNVFTLFIEGIIFKAGGVGQLSNGSWSKSSQFT